MQSEINHEEVLWSGSVSQWHYMGKWIAVLILISVLAGSFFFDLSVIVDFIWLLRGVIGAAVLLIIFWIRLDRSRRKYSVTNKRVSVEFGLISKRSNEVRVQDIRSINFKKTGISGLLGIGRIEFSSAATDDAEVVFWNCPDAEKVRDMVRSLQV
jgi:uncharacterized membrane protein YdbT with pleckstrin-like domain